ncbi:MAG TPA: respiratory nitrate reductase subunit gamma [Thermoleophilaceae bacterium]|nr:respiratory nitrate reductase subunit gamma [Thermoleophilaceae bacterium]
MSRGELLLYAVLPYAAIATFLVGHWWRYHRDQYRWTARSTQLLESRWLMVGSTLFHFGALGAIGGHVVGILVPHAWTDALGISESAYHVLAAVGGLAAGVAATLGFVVLAVRRARFPRVRVTTTRWDLATFFLLAFGITTGMICTIWGTLGEEVRYRETVAPYFRGLLALNPQPELMTGDDVPFVFQLHVSSVWLLYAAWPFSRLVHAWSIPVDWFRRSPIPYRGRVAAIRSTR